MPETTTSAAPDTSAPSTTTPADDTVASDEITRRVSAHLEGEVLAPSELVLAIAVAIGPRVGKEALTITVDGSPVRYVEVADDAGVRRHVVEELPTGHLVVDYSATVEGRAPADPVRPIDPIEMTWPSRYCDSDRLGPVSLDTFQGLRGKELVDAVVGFVSSKLAYVSGSTDVLDGATEVYLARQGVCRDFAHLTTALLRAQGVPARLVSVYAPGLDPMDFHAVVEVLLDGRWYVFDATCLAPRASLLRIASGRDAADTAFMTVPNGNVRLDQMTVSAVVDPALPVEDPTVLVELT